jgi:hypothetical protein
MIDMLGFLSSNVGTNDSIQDVFLVANGNLKQVTNKANWPVQAAMEAKLSAAFESEGCTIHRAHGYSEELGHGFIWNQRMGLDVIGSIDPNASIVVAVGVWQFSQNLLSGLRNHRGPILTIGNWSGKWPGLVGLLNLNACLVKANVPYSTIWSDNFNDTFFRDGIRQWLRSGTIVHEIRYAHPLVRETLPNDEKVYGAKLAEVFKKRKPIIGVFDEGCMGMYNAIIDDELLHHVGIYKERLSQSALLAAMGHVSDDEALGVRKWLEQKGMRFITGCNQATELTDAQIAGQCKMYIAAVRMAAEFGCDAIGIQYSTGLKDMAPASDLAEGLMNNPDRPPVRREGTDEILYEGKPLPHFNEADECAAIDMLVNEHIWSSLGWDSSTTLHDVRWGEHFTGCGIDDFIWVFMISGAIPASHLARGYAEAESVRQPPTSFMMGGGTLRGVSKPGEFVWSRTYIEQGELRVDLGRGRSVALPDEELQRRWNLTTPQWPIMNAILDGITRDQFMAKHRSNHIIITYAPDASAADSAMRIKASMMASLGIKVMLCGTK